MKAAPALATGHFSARPVLPALQESFACVWTHRLPEGKAPPVIITPDATIDLQWIDGKLRIAGPDRDPQTENIAAASTVIGFRFRPAASQAWLGACAHALLGQRLLLDELWGAKARDIARGIRPDQEVADLVCSLEAALVRCMPDRVSPDPLMAQAFALIREGPPQAQVLLPWLMKSLAMSERTLRRRFDQSFGYGPKTLDRILRYQRFLRLRRLSKGSSTALLAAEAGYSDQAHLVRESRRLTGSTPSELERMHMADIAASLGDAA